MSNSTITEIGVLVMTIGFLFLDSCQAISVLAMIVALILCKKGNWGYEEDDYCPDDDYLD